MRAPRLARLGTRVVEMTVMIYFMHSLLFTFYLFGTELRSITLRCARSM